MSYNKQKNKKTDTQKQGEYSPEVTAKQASKSPTDSPTAIQPMNLPQFRPQTQFHTHSQNINETNQIQMQQIALSENNNNVTTLSDLSKLKPFSLFDAAKNAKSNNGNSDDFTTNNLLSELSALSDALKDEVIFIAIAFYFVCIYYFFWKFEKILYFHV